jgi:DNA-binding transcriptional LysR family regulator
VAYELRLLRYFVALAEELHFGRAAARLYVSQPALSQQIRILEEQVGMPLFVRGSRGVQLTPVGATLLDEARDVLRHAERLEESVEQLRRGTRGTLRIGVPPGLPAPLLPAVLAPLRRGRSDVRIAVRELPTPEQVAALHDGSLDLGLVREPVDDPALERRCLLVELLGVSLPAGHPLAARVDAGFEASEHLSTTQGMLAAGLALTFSAAPWLEGVEGIVWRPLADARIEIRTAAAWRPGNRSPVLQSLVRALPAEVGAGPSEDVEASEPVGRHPNHQGA